MNYSTNKQLKILRNEIDFLHKGFWCPDRDTISLETVFIYNFKVPFPEGMAVPRDAIFRLCLLKHILYHMIFETYPKFPDIPPGMSLLYDAPVGSRCILSHGISVTWKRKMPHTPAAIEIFLSQNRAD